ncbi:MAG: phage regulatory protein/antirepressor Ant [Bacteroidaceae bacterium]|nr:phage regulatory protein/antirepressor Ant [Bacteroidaceae bacterium]
MKIVKRNMEERCQRMTSLEIAEVTGKMHKNVMQSIRRMEPAWEKECGLKFQLTSRRVEMPQGGVKDVPCYSLTKTECLYVATKFNDEARARLVLRWEQLEQMRLQVATVQPLLASDEDVLTEAERIVGLRLTENNQNADGCITTTEIARALGMEAHYLNSFLTDMHVQRWQRGQFRLTTDYEGRGLAQDRLFFYYSREGKQKSRTYLVWTDKGRDMIMSFFKG